MAGVGGMRAWWIAWVAAAGLASCAGCGGSSDNACTIDTDCEAGEVCGADGRCRPRGQDDGGLDGAGHPGDGDFESGDAHGGDAGGEIVDGQDAGAADADGGRPEDAGADAGPADGGDGGADEGPADGGDATGADSGMLVDCDGELVDLQTDPSHCGGCHIRCASGVSCLGGVCQVTCLPDEASLVADPVIDKDQTAIHAITVGGVNLVEANGGYYIIGTCTGADDELQNVISRGSDGSTLHAPGTCPGAPFSISYAGTNPLRVSITVGPLPVDYKGLSVPFDPHQAYFTDFRFSGSGYLVGCADTWSSRTGSGGPYTSIPQPCTIPGHGSVGLARVTAVPDGLWAQIQGPHATIRRVVLSSNLRELFFVRHPYTHNVELSWGIEPLSSSHLPAGSVYHLEEDLYILEPASGGASSARLVSFQLPVSGAPGSTLPAKVTLCNDGSTTWAEPADHVGGTRLGALPTNAITWVPGASGGYSNGATDQRIFVGAPVEPGATVTFDFGLALPQAAGSQLFHARMVHDGVAWFGPDIPVEIQVEP